MIPGGRGERVPFYEVFVTMVYLIPVLVKTLAYPVVRLVSHRAFIEVVVEERRHQIVRDQQVGRKPVYPLFLNQRSHTSSDSDPPLVSHDIRFLLSGSYCSCICSMRKNFFSMTK